MNDRFIKKCLFSDFYGWNREIMFGFTSPKEHWGGEPSKSNGPIRSIGDYSSLYLEI